MRKFVLTAYTAGALLAAFMGWALYRVTANAMQSSTRVDHTMQVLQQITGIDASIGRAESAQRGHLLYGDAQFVRERDRELQSANIHARSVASLTRDNFSQQERAAELLRLLETRAELMRNNAATADSGRRSAAFETSGGHVTSNIYHVTEAMSAEEHRLLDERKAIEARNYRLIRYSLMGCVLVLLLLIVPGWPLSARETARRLRAERSMFDLAESLPGAVFQVRMWPDGRMRFELLTSATAQVRGIDRDKALRDGNVMLESVVEADRKIVLGAFAQHAKDLTPLQIDYRCNVRGQQRWIRMLAAPCSNDDGSILWSGHWDDVTTQRELETELMRSMEAADAANRAKSTFLATMSHEIRTPMNGVLGMLELLALTDLDDDQRTTLGVIRESGKALLRIIDDILDFSKIEAGKLDLVPEVTSVGDVIDRVWNMYIGAASAKGLLLKRFFDSRISPAVMADPIRLQQILANFVSNALKFTLKGGASISAERIERVDGRDVIQFTVSDSGVGVSHEQQAKLFQPFAQAHDNVAAQYGGTGLGLAISRRLASMMGGDIRMESELGRGTRMIFTVSLPIADGVCAVPAVPVASKPVVARTPPSTQEAEWQRRLVLVVDDHPVNRMVLLRQVNAIGYAAETAEDGRQALDAWKSGRFSAVITDCNMPEMSGYDLAREIRAGEASGERRRTIIIACTANALGGEAQKCLDAGMDDYIAKPTTLEQLAEAMARWLPFERPSTDRLPPTSPLLERLDGSPPIDLQMVSEISGGDAALGHELLSRFRRHSAEDAQRLREAAASRDIPQIVMYSHRIKGASRMIGAARLALICEEIERSGHAEDVQSVVSHMPLFEMEVERLDEYIRNQAREDACR